MKIFEKHRVISIVMVLTVLMCVPLTAKPLIIFDTDMDSDFDDAGALAVLHALADNGECEILAVMHCTSTPWSVGVIDAINTYYHRGDIPIGDRKKSDNDNRSRYAEKIAKDTSRFKHNVTDLNHKDVVQAKVLYKRILSKQKDKSVTIVTVGPYLNLMDLLNDPEAVDLITKKVKLLSIMGGYFNPPGHTDWNVSQKGRYEDGPKAGKAVIERWPTPVMWSDVPIGVRLRTGERLQHTCKDNPVREAYRLAMRDKWHHHASWDQSSVLFAVRGLKDYWYAHTTGRPVIYQNQDGNWATDWLASPDGDHSYLIVRKDVAEMSKIIEDLMIQPPLNRHQANDKSGKKVPVIYCTDLYHPHNDPDDHFDIATLYSIPEIDIRAIILDQNNRCGWDQEKTPGSVPVSQLNYITKRNVPYAVGLRYNLVTPEDPVLWCQQDQKGIELLLDTLKKSPEPVTVITVGSLRDVAAAYNREPKLLREKIDRLFVFVGEASKKGFVDYNIDLDINAYIRIMDSDLPVYWVPCFDGGLWQNNGNASWWDASHKDLLSKASKKALNFFIYALLKKDKDTVNPLRYMDGEVDTVGRDKIFAMNRHLWCSSVFAYVAGRKIIRKNGEFVSIPAETSCCPKQVVDLFTFKDVAIDVDRPVRILTDTKPDKIRKVKLFQITNKDIYQKAMTSITADLLSRLGTDNL